MNEDVLVIVKTIQSQDGKEIDSIEKQYHGTMVEKDGSKYIRFSEDMSSNKSDTMKITEDEVIILRRSEAISNLRFKVGKIHRTDYKTEYNTFNIVIETMNMEKNIGDEIDIEIDYNIKILGLLDGNNKVRIKIKNK